MLVRARLFNKHFQIRYIHGLPFKARYSCSFKTLTMTKNDLIKESGINFLINGVINGLINWFQMDRSVEQLLTVDEISTSQHTVLSGAVMLAVSLALISTTIAYFTTKNTTKPPYFPTVFVLALKHSVYAFGLVTIFGLLIQRFVGSISVTPIAAATIAGLIGGIVAGIVNYETKKTIFNP